MRSRIIITECMMQITGSNWLHVGPNMSDSVNQYKVGKYNGCVGGGGWGAGRPCNFAQGIMVNTAYHVTFLPIKCSWTWRSHWRKDFRKSQIFQIPRCIHHWIFQIKKIRYSSRPYQIQRCIHLGIWNIGNLLKPCFQWDRHV